MIAWVMASAALPLAALAQPSDSIRSALRTVDVPTGSIETVFTADRHFEAPNWSPDGRFFIVNSGGRLYRIDAHEPRTLDEIPTGFATRANNDHGISPDGRWLVLSHHAAEHVSDPAQDWLGSSIYVLPIAGGAAPRKVTSQAPSFWHGWSPDGRTLAYVGRRDGEWDVYGIGVDGGEERRLTTCRGLDDGPDYSPDGAFIYYNSFCSGKMEIWRMRADGSRPQQLTRDRYSNWFPHPSPDGRWVVYLAYLEDQGESHPFGRQVKLRLLDVRDGSVRDLTAPFFGGQGTINVPSWSPDSRHVAFVEYEIRRWTKIWSDEFDGSAGARVDSLKWRYDVGDGCAAGICGWGNSEKQSYSDSTGNVALDGRGHLVITARPAPPGLACYYGACRYTSGKITTRGKFAAPAGSRVEARIRLPVGQGLWPAFWMLGARCPATPWPDCGELDVMEYRGSTPTATSSAVHGPGYSGNTPFAHRHNLERGRFADGFHTFAVEWDSLTVRFSVDGAVHYTVTRAELERFGRSVLDLPFFLILNLAVGGHFDGDPASDAILPASVVVDYVRVLRR